uniref:Putative secreted protein n=1 Tax=Anopheles darlingi TaxID=43151 RepID=A0A2M4DH18_ANODA
MRWALVSTVFWPRLCCAQIDTSGGRDSTFSVGHALDTHAQTCTRLRSSSKEEGEFCTMTATTSESADPLACTFHYSKHLLTEETDGELDGDFKTVATARR